MSIILKPDRQLISISIYYVEEVNKHGLSIYHFISSRDDFEDWQSKGYVPISDVDPGVTPPDEVIKVVSTQWKTMTWKDQNDLLSKAISYATKADGSTTGDIDAIKYRDMKLKTNLKGWSLTDEEGKPVPVTNAVIDDLNPEFAREMLSSYEKVVGEQVEDNDKT